LTSYQYSSFLLFIFQYKHVVSNNVGKQKLVLYIYIDIFNSLYKYLQLKIGSTKKSIPNVFVHLRLDKCFAHI
jgi:hypothetical protein